MSSNKDRFVLTESDKFYIEQHKDKHIDELSAAIGKNKGLVEQHLKFISQKTYEQNTKKKKGNSPLYDSMAKKSGAVAMTSTASMMTDDLEKERPRSNRGVDGKDIISTRKD